MSPETLLISCGISLFFGLGLVGISDTEGRAKLGIAVIVISLIVSLGAGGFTWDKVACNREIKGYNLEGNWSWMNGCRAELEGRLVPTDKLRFLPDGSIIVDGGA